MQLTFSPRRVAFTLGWAALVLLTVGFVLDCLANQYGGRTIVGLDRLVTVDGVGDIPTWFASILLLACSLAFAGIARIKQERGGCFAWRWRGLALSFLVMSIDKSVGAHRWANGVLRSVEHRLHLPGYSWVLLVAIAMPLLYFIYAPFVRILGREYHTLFGAATAVFLSGALVLDKLSAKIALVLQGGDIMRLLLTSIEEGLEIFGVILFLYALLRYIADLNVPLALQIAPAAKQVRPPHAERSASPHPQSS